MSIAVGRDDDSENCEELNMEECLETEDCIWDDEDGCMENEDDEDDDNDEDEEYEFRAHAKFEIEDDDEDEDYFGKLKTRITESSVHILEFDLKNLLPVTVYSVMLDGFWEYGFTTQPNGQFQWELRSDGAGDEDLPDSLIPVSDLEIAELFDADGNLFVSGIFVMDDEGCEDLPEDLCASIPFCTWDAEEECQENEWDFDDDDGDGVNNDDDDDDDNDGIPDDEDDEDDNPWDEGEYFIEEIMELYTEYVDYYNETGEGLFNFVTITEDVIRDERGIDIGTEIGLLDYGGNIGGADCAPEYASTVVGAGVWQGEPLTLFSFGTFDNCDAGGQLFPGFIPTNTVVLRLYDPNDGLSYDIVTDAVWGGSQSSNGLVLGGPPVDINGDGILDILDLVIMVDMTLGGTEPTPEGDYNNDGVINILDIVLVIEIILASV